MVRWPPLPDYGCFFRWPADDASFIHPSDVAVVTKLIPGERVLRRFHFDDTFYHYSYGRYRFRLRPAMWTAVKHEGLDIGDEVETTGLGLERERFVARIWGMHFSRRHGQILYRLRSGDGSAVDRLYAREHLLTLTEKRRVKPGDTVYPVPKALDKRDRVAWEGEELV